MRRKVQVEMGTLRKLVPRQARAGIGDADSHDRNDSMRLHERVTKIEAVLPTLATKEDLAREVGTLRSEMHQGFAKVNLEFGKVRQEMSGEFGKVRQEMSGEFAKVRQEMGDGFDKVRQEMSSEFAKVRREIGGEVSTLRGEIGGVKQEVTSVKQEVTSVKQEVTSVKQEVTSVKQEVASVKQEVASVKQEVASVKQEVASVRHEVRELRQTVFSEINGLRVEMHQSMGALMWRLIGTLITVCTALVAATHFISRGG
ncbi:hypothetical protein AT302_01000 [Pandoraea norimbergensis]|uniref:DUF1640 domain-containing protein n=2 Tax=Pandoraea norimbergensis TaxID=93219 RepID=A0ABM5WE80_9BURK|nr:hypothetical protein AT302_01000 [Pandoraea norimbergensis]